MPVILPTGLLNFGSAVPINLAMVATTASGDSA